MKRLFEFLINGKIQKFNSFSLERFLCWYQKDTYSFKDFDDEDWDELYQETTDYLEEKYVSVFPTITDFKVWCDNFASTDLSKIIKAVRYKGNWEVTFTVDNIEFTYYTSKNPCKEKEFK